MNEKTAEIAKQISIGFVKEVARVQSAKGGSNVPTREVYADVFDNIHDDPELLITYMDGVRNEEGKPEECWHFFAESFWQGCVMF
jgi:hypothetical protein